MKDNSVYLSFISALAISEKDPRKELVKELHQKILTKAAENVPTNNPHIYEKARNVIILPDDFKELHANLFSDYYGLHPRLYGYKHELQSSFEISSYSLTQLFSVSDNGKLTVFLKQLKPIEIRRIWDKLEEENQTKYLKTIPFIPNTSGHFSSLKDFIVEENYFFCYPCDQLDFLSRQLPQHGIICNQTISTFNVLVKTSFPNLNKWLIKEWNSIIIQNKLKETSAILSKMPPLHKQKLVNNLINHDKKAFNDFIRTELSVFYNKEGKANTLSQLLSGGRFSLKTDLIDSLCIKTEERVLNDTEAYLAASSQYHHITINNINLEGFIQNNPKKQTDVLEDLLVLYNASQPKNNIIDPQLKIFYDGKKWIAPSSVFLTPGMSKLEEKDYNTIKKLIFPEVGSTLPYNKELLQLLNKPAFKNIFKITNFKDWTFEVLDLSLKQLKAFVTLVKNEEAPFFSLFKIENHNGSFKITPAKKMQYSNAEKNLNDFLKQNGYFPLPDSLNGMFSGESNLINAGSDKFISSLIDQHGALNAFCWAVKSCNIETKNKFIENLSSVDIKSNRSYNNDSEEIALIDIVLSSSNPDLLKEKLKVNGVFWTEIGVNNDIICNNHHYELSELTGQDDSISKDKLIKLLQDVDNQKKLNEVLEMKQIFVSEIKDELLQVKSLSPIQFCFLVDTATADESLKSQICEHFSSLDENPDLVNLFEEGLERKIINIGEFCDCLSDSSSNIYHKVNPTKAELWLSNEIIPENLIRWAEKSDENKDFLKSQLDKQTNVKITEEIRENLIKSNNLTVVQHSLFNQTMNWAFEGGILIKRENADILLNEIYNKKLEHEFVLVFMRWDKTEVSLKLAKMASYYLKPDSIRHVSYLVGSSIPPQEVAFSLNSILEKQKDKFPEWKELTIEETLNENKTKSTEWKEPTYTNAYKNWKNHPENNHSYTIFITNEKVPFRYRLLIDKKLQNELGSRDNGTVGRIKIETSTKNEKPRIKLYIYQSSESKESILSKIEQYQNDLFPFKSEIQDLVRLFSQINKSNTELIDTLNKNGVSNPDELKKYFESQTVHQTDNSSALISSKDENVSPANVWIDGIEEMDNKEDFLNSLDALKDLFEKYGSNALNKIMHNLMIEEEEEEDNSIPSILSGYIGEQLFKEWLKHSPGKEEVRWVADKKAAFDIEWGESARIEVKTKLKTLYDDSKTYRSTAVYLRESQFDYLEVENPGLDYYLSIISLEDLNLKKHYAGWKSKLQENADLTELTDSIKMDIQRFANEFMKEESKRTFFQQKVKFLSLDDAKKKSDFSFLIQN